MDETQLSEDWATWAEALQQAFPRIAMPGIFPRAALGAALIERIAAAHDLTPGEVREIVSDIVLHRIATAPASRAA
jgi:hypothetical protein